MSVELLTGPLGGYLLALSVIGGLLKLYMSEQKNSREDRERYEERNDARWQIVSEMITATRESNLLVRQTLDRQDRG